MATVVLFHAVLGVRPSIKAFADELRAAGHTVHVPDLWDGEGFDTIDEGMQKNKSVGNDEGARRAEAAVADLPTNLVYMGYSLGAAFAQMLTQKRPGAIGAVLLYGALPASIFGSPWPEGVPVQIHTMEHDPWVEMDEVNALVEDVRTANGEVELFLYPGSGHLFMDTDHEDYEPMAATSARERILSFLQKLP